MHEQILTSRSDLVIRRLILEPGEAMPWHTDPCHRFTVVVRGDLLRIEFRDGRKNVDVPVEPGLAEWDEPEPCVHRGVNAGRMPYEEVVMFFLDPEAIDPQPEAHEVPRP